MWHLVTGDKSYGKKACEECTKTPIHGVCPNFDEDDFFGECDRRKDSNGR